MIWNRDDECMDPEQRRELQLGRLRDTIARVMASLPLYRDRLGRSGVEPDAIRSVEDLRHLPFTTKDDLRATYPYGLFTVPLTEVVRLHASSGTTGRPSLVGYTRDDVALWAETMARAISAAGGTSQDILHVAYGYGLFTGGLGFHYGGELLGCTVVPMSAGNTKRQLMMMRDLGSTLLACTPSYALTLADAAADEGIEPERLKLKSGLFGAEPWSEGIRTAIEDRLGIFAQDNYGLSEVIGPGVAAECEEKSGLHIFDDHFIPEIIDPDTGDALAPGERGELVFTCLTKQCLPLIRYRTGDLSALDYEPCPCGRTHPRMARVMGRTDDMLIIRGVNVFPSQIEDVLSRCPGAAPHYQMVLTRKGRLDMLEVQVEAGPESWAGREDARGELERRIQEDLRAALGVSANVRLVAPKGLPRSEGKAACVIDRRREV
ncbi:MAG: phenylacetate--CoA ligase family protein [Armatimonadota bacterium]